MNFSYLETGLISAKQAHQLLEEQSKGQNPKGKPDTKQVSKAKPGTQEDPSNIIPKVQFIDASYVLPHLEDNRAENFQKERIGNACFFDIDSIADRSSDLPHMLPDEQIFARAMQNFNISQKDLIIVYGQDGIVMGPARVWWTFKVFGHDNIYLLDGGFPAWKNANLPLNEAPAKENALFNPLKNNTQNNNYARDLSEEIWRWHRKQELVKSQDDIKKAIYNKKIVICDARPSGRFEGIDPEPRPNLKKGAIENSINIPALSLIHENNGQLLPKDILEKYLSPHKDKEIIASCGSGVTAAFLAFAFYTIGIKNVSVYDASWAEWGRF